VYGRPKGKRAEAPRVPAGIAMLAAAKFGDLPLGGFAGEMLPAARTALHRRRLSRS